MHAQYPTTFEQMIVSMRQRLRPTDAYLLADRLQICIGLNYLKTDETRLLKMLLEEVSLTWLARHPTTSCAAAYRGGAGHRSNTWLRCRIVSRIRGRCLIAAAKTSRALSRLPADLGAVLGPLLDLVEVAVVRNQRVVGLFGGPVAHSGWIVLWRQIGHFRRVQASIAC
jgi:hypothetical protein